MKRSIYSLVYQKPGEEKKRLYEDEFLVKVEKKRLEFSLTYNSDFLSIEELTINKIVHETRKDEEDDIPIGKGSAVLLILIGVATFINFLIKHKYGE